MRRTLPLLLVLLAGLTGCVEAEESWNLDRKGGGTYKLVLRWNAGLWRRVGDVLGPKVMARVAGNGFPLHVSQLRDGLSGLEGVTIKRLESKGTDSGLTEIGLEVGFRHLRDLLAWEVMAGRTIRVDVKAPDAQAAGRAAGPGSARLYMEPIPRVPVLDKLAALLEAEAKPPPKAPRGAAQRDPPPLERLGLARRDAGLVWRMLKLPLEKVSLKVNVALPGDLLRVGGRPADESGRTASFDWDFAALRKAGTDRTVRLSWRMLSLDEAPRVKNEGRADPRSRRPDGSTQKSAKK